MRAEEYLNRTGRSISAKNLTSSIPTSIDMDAATAARIWTKKELEEKVLIDQHGLNDDDGDVPTSSHSARYSGSNKNMLLNSKLSKDMFITSKGFGFKMPPISLHNVGSHDTEERRLTQSIFRTSIGSARLQTPSPKIFIKHSISQDITSKDNSRFVALQDRKRSLYDSIVALRVADSSRVAKKTRSNRIWA